MPGSTRRPVRTIGEPLSPGMSSASVVCCPLKLEYNWFNRY
jgi:hypothetical protein